MESENLFENWNWKSETKQKTNKTKRLSIMNEWTSENDERKNQVKIKFMMLEGDLIDHNVFHLLFVVVCLEFIGWKNKKFFNLNLFESFFDIIKSFFGKKNLITFNLAWSEILIEFHTHTQTLPPFNQESRIEIEKSDCEKI